MDPKVTSLLTQTILNSEATVTHQMIREILASYINPALRRVELLWELFPNMAEMDIR